MNTTDRQTLMARWQALRKQLDLLESLHPTQLVLDFDRLVESISARMDEIEVLLGQWED